MERRDFMKTAAGTSMLLLANQVAFAEEAAKPVGDSKARIFQIEHPIAPLPFKPAKLNGLSEKLIQSHWENNYAGSVKTLNALRKKMGEAMALRDTPPFVYNGLKREHLMRTGSVVLHEMYFGNLGGSGQCGSKLQKKIAADFGSFAAWEDECRKIAAGLGGGSGWVITGYNYQFKTIENYWSADHMHTPPATVPLLVMDMYEHSYQIDFGAANAKYIDAFFKNINWDVVEARLDKALKS